MLNKITRSTFTRWRYKRATLLIVDQAASKFDGLNIISRQRSLLEISEIVLPMASCC